METTADIDPQILAQIKTILRRDLKLGPDALIPDDMPFFGGNVDLDSLDMLLLVTSLEKQFGIKVPNEAVGKEVFQNVSSLTRYVQQQGGPVDGAVAPAIVGDNRTSEQWIARLPHGKEFLFISGVRDVKPGESAAGYWDLAGTEPFFAGHFPGHPIVPGVLIAEALAQISGMTAPDAGDGGKLVKVDVRFERPVVPPVRIELKSELSRMIGQLQFCSVTASVGADVVARGTITLHRG